MAKLTEAEVNGILAGHPAWSLTDGFLVRTWTFASFAEAMIFVNRVAMLAEQADHHPDIDIRYKTVRLALISHDVGALTKRDAAFVLRLSEEVPGREA